MNDYVIFTDSACDLPLDTLGAWQVECLPLHFSFEGEAREYADGAMDLRVFYDKMRQGGVARTSAINPGDFSRAFQQALEQGRDVLYVGFSSGLSATFQSARIAAAELQEKYPQSQIVLVDTLAISLGVGLLVQRAVKLRQEGKSLRENAAILEEMKLHLAQWGTVDDLVYLKRGGRISPAVALVGQAMGIKPVLCMDKTGKLENVTKARGQKAAFQALRERYLALAKAPQGGKVSICHSDAPADAALLARMLQEVGAQVERIGEIGPVIGAHTGPGLVAIFFMKQ